METIIIISLAVFLGTSLLIFLVLSLIQHGSKVKTKKAIENLEYEKNVIDCYPIVPELSKIEKFLNNDKLKTLYNTWNYKLEEIKKSDIPALNDMIIDVEYATNNGDKKTSNYKLARLELEIYKLRAKSERLLSEIVEITSSDEKNREIITELRKKYRELKKRFESEKSDYGVAAGYVLLQFENIASRFEQFEIFMEQNEYTEVTGIIKAISDMLKHMEIVVEEVPIIVITSTSILRKKINDTSMMYEDLRREGFPLDYLNVEFNIDEAKKKIEDILDRLKMLNLEDSLFDLKVLMDYFDNLVKDFEKEKSARTDYEELIKTFKRDLNKSNKLVGDIFYQIDEINELYSLTEDDFAMLKASREELRKLEEDYNTLMKHSGNKTFAFSKLLKEIRILENRLNVVASNLENSLDAISEMKEDETRARQQLDEIKLILKDSKLILREYNFPVIRANYHVELKEAEEALREVVKELEKTPITISTLNTRVDTARDLVLKLFSNNKEMLKNAMLSEMAIVYGNRYRLNSNDAEKYLSYSEMLFMKGDYQKSLELSINTLNKIENGILEKLLKLYQDKKENA